jgi:hypothetical protein
MINPDKHMIYHGSKHLVPHAKSHDRATGVIGGRMPGTQVVQNGNEEKNMVE